MSILANLHAPGAKCRNHEINVGISFMHVQVFANPVQFISSKKLLKTCSPISGQPMWTWNSINKFYQRFNLLARGRPGRPFLGSCILLVSYAVPTPDIAQATSGLLSRASTFGTGPLYFGKCKRILHNSAFTFVTSK